MNKKIYFFVSSMYTKDRGRGGISALLHQLIPRIKRSNSRKEIVVVSLFGDLENNSNINEEIIQKSVAHQSDLSILEKTRFWCVSSMHLIKFIVKNYKSLKSSKIISTSPGPSVILAICFRKIFIWENVSFFVKRGFIDFLRLVIFRFREATLIIPTKIEMERLSKIILIPKIIYIPDWHDPLIKPSKRQTNPKKIRFMAAGMLEKRKGFDLLINAVSNIDNDILKSIHFSIYGDGPEFSNLQDLIQRNGLYDIVKLEGFSQNLTEEYLKFDCFILSSRYEGFPLVMVNGLASGMPVIAFDCETGPRDIITNRNGILVKNGDIAALSEAITIFNESYSKRFFFEDCVESASKYNLESIQKYWISMLDD